MIGETISHYRILEKLGEGGMGVVYKAMDTKLDRFVAMKFLPFHLTTGETERARFVQEAKAAAALNHPNVCVIHEIQDEHDAPFMVMEYVEGQTLRHKIAAVGTRHAAPLQIDEAIAYAIQIGEALQAAHEKGIVHRDVKSDNIMVTPKNQIKVMDFGLAKIKGALKLTKSASTVGTIAYMSPEQLQGVEADARSDIFSFGVVLYEMLTGQLPFRGEYEAALMYSIVHEDPPPPQNVSPEMLDIVNCALEKNPDQRYPSVAGMVDELRWLQEPSASVSRKSRGKRISAGPTKLSRKTRAHETITQKTARSLVVPAIIAGIAILGIIGYYRFFGKPAEINSMAILPFENVGNDPNTEYLSDGIPESLINSLSPLPGLKMMSRGSTFRYKGKAMDPQAVGRQLGIRAVLTGRVIQRGDHLYISAELVDVRDNSHLWGDQYNRKLADLLVVQEEIVREISQALRSTLTGEEEKRLTKRYTQNAEAYQLYLKARYYSTKWTGEGIKKGMEYLHQAIAMDSSYALAYAGLAACYYDGAGELFPHDVAMPKARQAAQQALELDDMLAEAHATLGMVKLFYDLDWPAAERQFKRALELNPNYADAYLWYSEYDLVAKRPEEAVAKARKAQELDPLSPLTNYLYGSKCYKARQYDQAIAQFQKTLEIDSTFEFTLRWMGYAYLQKGMHQEAVNVMQKTVTVSGGRDLSRLGLAYAYAVSGKRAEARKLLEDFLEQAKASNLRPFYTALVYVGLNEKDQALHWLQKAYEKRDELIIDLHIDPRMDGLRSDPRFVALLKKVGLEK